MSLTRREVLAIGLGVGGVASVLAAVVLLVTVALAGQPAVSDGIGDASFPAFGSASPDTSGAPSADLIIDVQGAVKRPGVVLLPPGSRVSDALEAAGGYARHADLNAAAASLNLAATLTDGAQVYVPVLGVAGGPGGTGGTGGTGGGGGTGGSGLVNLNTATPEELEALPGIGPVTVQKIVAGRAEQPFATLDEMVERGIIDRGQFEDIRELVTF
ncbi:MAG: SLBB domain-containing protein [Chloroflexota bacterium]